MAAMRAPESIDALRADRARRGQAERISVRLHDALAGPMEGTALVADILAAVERMTFAATNDSFHGVVNEAHRLGKRAAEAGIEFHRIAGRIEGPDAA